MENCRGKGETGPLVVTTSKLGVCDKEEDLANRNEGNRCWYIERNQKRDQASTQSRGGQGVPFKKGEGRKKGVHGKG